MLTPYNVEEKAVLKEQTPLERFGTPEEEAACASLPPLPMPPTLYGQVRVGVNGGFVVQAG